MKSIHSAFLRTLVAQDRGLLEGLVVIDAEHAAGEAALRDQAAVFRRKVARARVAEGHVGLKAVQIDGADAAVTPSSLELCQAIGNVMGVLNSTLKS